MTIKHVLGLSGGKDSAALAIYMRDTYPKIDIAYYFTDTGKELKETYDFLDKLEEYLQKPILRLNENKGFDYHLEKHNGYLPSMRQRWCTRVLKIKPFENWVKEYLKRGYDEIHTYIGIRSDEASRKGYRCDSQPKIISKFPFIENGIDKEGVYKILNDAGVGLPDYYRWRSRSGCYFCFYQRRIEWVRLKEEHPELFEKAKAYEKKGYTWHPTESLEDLEKPERIAQIKENYEKSQRRLNNLNRQGHIPFDPEDLDECGEENFACITCHR